MTGHVNIIGGGIAGLSAAWELQRRGVTCTVLEQSARLGGKIQTEHHAGFLLESAADSFISQKPHALQLVRELGLEAELISPNAETRNLYFLRGGRLERIPASMKLIVPLNDEAFLQSRLLSPAGLKRYLDEQLVPPREEDGDETLAEFAVRRFGCESLSFIAPLLAGIYATDPHQLSMRAAFPQYLELERVYGSVIRGVRVTQRQLQAGTPPAFYALRRGMGTLIAALERRLGASVQRGVEVTRVEQDGTVVLRGGERLVGDATLLATPAAVTRALLGPRFAPAADILAQFHVSGSAAVALAFHASQVAFPLDTHGFLVSHAEDTPLMAVTLHSSKLPGRAPEGQVLLRAFLNGTTAAAHDAESLTRLALREVQPLLGLRGPPLFSRVYNWANSNPAYHPGHLERVAALQAILPRHLRVIGSSYGGVGLPDCIRFARQEAAALATLHGRESAAR